MVTWIIVEIIIIATVVADIFMRIIEYLEEKKI